MSTLKNGPTGNFEQGPSQSKPKPKKAVFDLNKQERPKAADTVQESPKAETIREKKDILHNSTDKDRELLAESKKRGLTPKETRAILDGKYGDLQSIQPESRRKMVMQQVMDMKEKGLLDGDVSGKHISEEELKEFAKKHNIPEKDLRMSKNGTPEYTGQTPPNMNFPEGTPEQAKQAVQAGMSQIGIHENSGKADKYLQEIGYKGLNAKSTPWCAAFVHWSLKQGGVGSAGNPSLSAKAFIQEGGKGHVGFKVGNQLLGGNQSNQVSLKPLNTGKVKGWVMPGKMNEIHKKGGKDFDPNNIPDGAIVVFDRGAKTT